MPRRTPAMLHGRLSAVPSGRYIDSIYSTSMLDLAILGLLEDRGELHGYEVRKRLRDDLGLLANVSYGSLYPALARLEAAGWLEAVDPATARPPTPEPVPPTGSLTGEWAVLRAHRHAGRRALGRRSRKAYRITDAGRARFCELLSGAGAGDDPRTFGLRLAFAGHMPAPARLALLERRRSQLAVDLVEARTSGAEPGLDVYARSVVDHTAEVVEHDIGWLDRLIETERSGLRRAAAAGA